MKKWPVFRDLFFYVISGLALFGFSLDERIEWYEALLLVCWYGIYLGILAFNDKIEQKLKVCLKIQQGVSYVYKTNEFLLFAHKFLKFEVTDLEYTFKVR